MGFFDPFNPIRRQFRSVIQWENPGEDELFRKWSDDGDEIKNASKLIANPGQGCIFVYEGKIRNVLDREGMIELSTGNIPFWTTLTKSMQAFESEHKVGIHFFRKTRILNQKWGTASPIKYEDPEFRFPVALKAFGNFSCQIMEPEKFFLSVVGARDLYTVSDLREALLSLLVPVIGEYLAEKKLAYIDVDARRHEIAAGVLQRLGPDFAKLGFTIEDFRIEGTDFDEGTKQRIGGLSDKLADRTAADRLGISYGELQKLMALRDAARNEGGAAGVLVGAGTGAGLAGRIAPDTVNAGSAGALSGEAGEGAMSRLRKLKGLLDEKLISEAEFTAKKQEILKDI